jgi:hypothetical protein
VEYSGHINQSKDGEDSAEPRPAAVEPRLGAALAHVSAPALAPASPPRTALTSSVPAAGAQSESRACCSYCC